MGIVPIGNLPAARRDDVRSHHGKTPAPLASAWATPHVRTDAPALAVNRHLSTPGALATWPVASAGPQARPPPRAPAHHDHQAPMTEPRHGSTKWPCALAASSRRRSLMAPSASSSRTPPSQLREPGALVGEAGNTSADRPW